MAFKIAAPQFVDHTIKSLPTGPDGAPQSMHVIYKVLPDAEVATNPQDEEAVKEFLRRAVHDIDDLLTEAGGPLPFTPDLLGQLLEAVHLRMALWNGYGRALARAAQGN